MATHGGLLILVYVAASAQAVLAPRIAIGPARPEFLLLVAVAAGLLIRDWPALAWAAASGLIGDCLSDRPLGLGMLVATVVVLFVQRRLHERPASTLADAAVPGVMALFTMMLARETISTTIAGDAVVPVVLVWASASSAAYSSAIGLAAVLVWRALRSCYGRLQSAQV